MFLSVAVVNLMLIRTDEDIFQKVEIPEPDMGMPQIGTQEEEQKVQRIDAEKSKQADIAISEIEEETRDKSLDGNAANIIDNQLDRVEAILREGREVRGGVMDFVKFPEEGNFVHHIMYHIGGEIVDYHNRHRI